MEMNSSNFSNKWNLQTELRFAAPGIKGFYTFALSVKSDSYMDADFTTDIKVLLIFLRKILCEILKKKSDKYVFRECFDLQFF